MKPLGRKNYGSIGHLPNSRLGPGDHSVTPGQARIATEKARDKHDVVIVQEKLDGSNVGVALLNGEILALGRSGYLAQSSKYEMHQLFAVWVRQHEDRFRAALNEGERIAGEWLAQAHGTIYKLDHDPFVAFDLLIEDKRFSYLEFAERAERGSFVTPYLVSYGNPVSVENALKELGEFGHHGAEERIEGAVWRVERKGKVDFLTKFVRSDKVDGKYLNGDPVWMWRP